MELTQPTKLTPAQRNAAIHVMLDLFEHPGVGEFLDRLNVRLEHQIPRLSRARPADRAALVALVASETSGDYELERKLFVCLDDLTVDIVSDELVALYAEMSAVLRRSGSEGPNPISSRAAAFNNEKG